MKIEKDYSAETDNLGKKGEAIAKDYLINNGYQILDVNWRWGHKEVDIVARIGAEIIMMEVKTRDQNYAMEPWKSVTPNKIRNIVEVAEHWLRYNRIDLETRFDVISIVVRRDGNHILEHIEGAFSAPVN
jgi:putative endonuclease